MSDTDLILHLHRALRKARPFVVTGHHRGTLKAKAMETVLIIDSALVIAERMLVETGRMTSKEVWKEPT